ncbi:MAG: thioredoxin family protein [Rubripirellula sp.]
MMDKSGNLMRMTRFLLGVFVLWLSLVAPAKAQVDFGADLFPELTLGGGVGEIDNQQEPVTWTASYVADGDGNLTLRVQAEMAPTWHVYSVTQPEGGPTRTSIEVTGPAGVSVSGTFTPSEAPKKSKSEFYGDLTIEEHEGKVVWTSSLKTPAGFAEPVNVSVKGLVCKSGGDNRCMPTSADLVAERVDSSDDLGATSVSLGSEDSAAWFEQSVGFRDGEYAVEWKGAVHPVATSVGSVTAIRLQAIPNETYHVYQSVIDDSDSSTNFVVTDKAGLRVGLPEADHEAVTHSLLPSLQVSYYEGAVAWSLPVQIPEGTSAGEKVVAGMIAYQACTESSCLQPMALSFTATLRIGDDGKVEAGNVSFTSARRGDALDAAATTQWVDEISLASIGATAGAGGDASSGQVDAGNAEVVSADANSNESVATSDGPSLLSLLGLALLGGLILNVMPCVLPVVGLKVMGFIQQAGENRARVAALNFAYVGGIMFVFTIFAIVAAVTKFGWGEQFTFFSVKYTMTLVTFAFALSYLGVWEFPSISIGSGNKARELENREGLMGAFSKGIFATVLATPCSGPLLGYVMGVTYELSAFYTFLIFVTLGVGMSLPYIFLGLRPSLISWLPKPGEWMNKLKEFMAFLFLGTVAFFFSQFNDADKLPVFVSLIAVWFGFWITAQVESYRPLKARLTAWAGGITSAVVISMIAFSSLRAVDVVDWQDYTEPGLQKLQSEGRTVMLDFGATWCLTCKYNYKTALNTAETRAVIDELDAVAMYADWSDYSDEIKVKLEELNSRSIPLLVIYPGSQPDQPIILRDIVTQSQVIDALRQAGASVDRKALNDLPRLQAVASALAPTVPAEMAEANDLADTVIGDIQGSRTGAGAVMMLGTQL